jgi:tetratricopeptide (TPR) repeat protein
MKRLILAMIVALMATGSAYAQLVKRYNTATLNRAEDLMNEGKLEESLILFEEELKEHPKNPYAHFLMTTVYMEMGRYDEAMPAIDKALKYVPKRHKEMRGIAHALKATIHQTFQEWDEAVKQLTLCLSVLPRDEASYQHRAVAHNQRAKLYYKLGKNELAKQDIQKSSEFNSLATSK